MPDDGPDNEGCGGSESGQESGGSDGPDNSETGTISD